MKKSLLWIVVLLLSIAMVAVFSLASCKAKEVAEEEEAPAVEEEVAEEEEALPPLEERTPLKFWYNPSIGEDGRRLYQRFSDEVWPLDMMPVATPFEENIITKWATGERPDILDFQTETQWIGQLQAGKNMVDLRDMEFVKRTKYDLLNRSVGCVGPNGEVYGAILSGIQNMGFIYYKPIFEELGLSIPKDAEEFIALCQKIKDAGHLPLYIGLIDGYPGNQYFHALLTDPIKELEESKGISWCDEINRGVRSFGDDGVMQEAFDVITTLTNSGYFQKDFVGGTFEGCLTSLINGEAAMVMQGTWVVGVLAGAYGLDEVNEKIGMFALSMNSNTATGGITTPSFYVPKTGNSVTEQGAKEFIKWVTGTGPYGEAYQEYVTNAGILATIEGYADGEESLSAIKEMNSYAKVSQATIWWTGLAAGVGNMDTYSQNVFAGTWTVDDLTKALDESFAKNAQLMGLPGW